MSVLGRSLYRFSIVQMIIANKTTPCYPAREAVSNGVLQADSPINFALPLLIIQIALVLLVTRSMALLFRLFRQPRVLAEIIGGVLLGPTCFGRNKAYLNAIFPKESLTLLDTIATLGLLFFLFMVGLELDFNEIRRSGKVALSVALVGIALPFTAGIGLASLLKQSFSIDTKLAPLVVFLGVPLAITSFGVLVRIMAEHKLLTTSMGKMVVPAAAINDFFAWIFLAIGVSISGPSRSPSTPAYVLLCGIGFVLIMLVVVKKGMEWLARKANGEEKVSENYVCVTMVGVLASGFITDAIGIHPLFGALVFGLTVPKEGNFSSMLIEKIEDFITVLMLPLFFASSGLKTNLGSINNLKAFGLLILVILTATIGKIGGTVVVVLVSLRMKLHEAFAFGFLMNTKGLAELIVLNVGKDLGVLNDEIFAILVLMCLLMMFLTTPAVMALYKPEASGKQPTEANSTEYELDIVKDEFRILVCIHGTRTIAAVLNLIEACRNVKKNSLRLHVMHLIELTDRPSTVMALGRARSNEAEAVSVDDNIFVAFQTYGQLRNVPIKLLSAISELADMHVDVCRQAAHKKISIIILPATYQHKEDGTPEYVSHGLRHVYHRILQHAPCPVAVLVDKGKWRPDDLSTNAVWQKVAMVFVGGSDDREALTFACRLADHINVTLWVHRVVPANMQMERVSIDWQIDAPHDHKLESAASDYSLDNESLLAVREFRKRGDENPQQAVFYEEHSCENPLEAILSLARATELSLIVVGKEHHPVEWDHDDLSQRRIESFELGIIGDTLVTDGEVTATVVAIQHCSPDPIAVNSD